MTGYRSTFFRHKCAVAGCYIDGLPCWDDLIQQFPRKIRPTDVDGMVEINGHFLFIEEKGPGVGPDEGQRRALLTLSTWPNHTVLFTRPGSPHGREVLIFRNGAGSGWRPCSDNQFYAWLRRWARAADAAAPKGNAS